MTPHDLIAAFDALADAPDGVAGLRELVLQLAVRGRLVPQDPTEESAATAAHRALGAFAGHRPVRGRMAASTTMKGDAALSVGPPESPRVPTGWAVVPLSAVTRLESGHTPDRSVSDYWGGPFRWIGIRDARLHHGGTVRDTEQSVTQAGIDNSATRLLPEGTVCLSRTASVGYSVIMGAPMCTSQDFVNFICSEAMVPHYLQVVFLAEARALRRFAKGAVHSTIYFPEVKAFHVLLPPVAEQHRILAREDELMGLLDRLEAARTARDATRAAVRDSALDALRNADTAEDVEAAWTRVAERLDDLLCDPADIGQVRQTILQLAVRGRLVPQDSTDEPAATRLGRRAVTLAPAEAPFSLPQGWAWSSIDRLGRVLGGGTPDKRNVSYWGNEVPWVTPKDMKRDRIATSSVQITRHAVAGSSVKLVPPGSLLMVVRGMILAHSFPTALTTAEVTVNQDMKALVPFDPALTEFLLLASKGIKPQILARVERSTHGTCKLPSVKLFREPISIPPWPEQRRILARVDALMRLLDRLEARLIAAQTTHAAFAAAAVHRLDA